MGNKGRFLVLASAVLAVAGCGSLGPEVRVSPDAFTWHPSWVAVMPVISAGNAIPKTAALPTGLTSPKNEDAARAVASGLVTSFAARSSVPVRAVAFTTTLGGKVAEKAAGQYLDTRAVDPSIAAKLGTDTGADAVLLVAVLRYGPEVEGDLQTMSRGANTTVGKSQMAISTSVSSAITYFNVHFRCAMVRCADGAILWDVAVRHRDKRSTLMNVTQESVLQEAIEEVVDTFPWAAPRKAADSR